MHPYGRRRPGNIDNDMDDIVMAQSDVAMSSTCLLRRAAGATCGGYVSADAIYKLDVERLPRHGQRHRRHRQGHERCRHVVILSLDDSACTHIGDDVLATSTTTWTTSSWHRAMSPCRHPVPRGGRLGRHAEDMSQQTPCLNWMWKGL